MQDELETVDVKEVIDCPLCLGCGKLTRVEIMERLGMKDSARVAQLSAEEAIRLMETKQREKEETNWGKFDAELNRRVKEVVDKHSNELQTVQSELEGRIMTLEAERSVWEERKQNVLEKQRLEYEGRLQAGKNKSDDLTTKVERYQNDITQLNDKTQRLEAELTKVARVGKREELNFQEEVASWNGIWISDKLSRYGDYLVAFREPSGEPREPKMVVDNKDKGALTDDDLTKVVRDAKEQGVPVALLVVREEYQLRPSDRERRWWYCDGIWVLRTARSWLLRDLDLLKPILEKMGAEGSDFLKRNVRISDEVLKSLVDLDRLAKELDKASRAITTSKDMVASYRGRLKDLCDTVARDNDKAE